MSVCRKLPDGTIQKIAGHTILLDANAQEIREGTWSMPTSSSTSFLMCNVTFTDPMPDDDYAVVIEADDITSYQQLTQLMVRNKTTTGFEMRVVVADATFGIMTGRYTAWKPVKIEGYTEMKNKVENPDNTPTIDSMNLVTSDGVARAIENASAVWKGTKAEWNALPATDKVKYDLAVLLDTQLIKAIDRTDGSDTDVADLSGQFVGTHAEWEAESNKTQYKTALLTDERTTVNEVTSTGALNEVADNARIWRGTKEEWEALTDEERDKWDQAEIETIEAQGLNPFRTLSDIEVLSIAVDTDYTCPHDGFISVESPIGNDITTYINGNVYGIDTDTPNTRSVHTIPVCKGDVFKYSVNAGTASIRARWYTTDINPGLPIDTPVINRSQALDWDNMIHPTDAEMQAGWTAPADGYFIDCTIPRSAGNGVVLLNNIIMGTSHWSSTYWAAPGIQIPVAKGDVLKHSYSIYQGWEGNVFFVPYLDYPDYSTTEHWTGRRWIDGKKIYSKVFPFTGNPYPSSIGTIPGVDYVVDIDGTVLNTANNWHALGGYVNVGYAAWVTGENVYIGNGGNTPFAKGTVIIEYTKTTD